MNPEDNQPISEEEAFSPDGVDGALIRSFLKVTPTERLALLQEYLDSTFGTPRDQAELQRDFCRQLRRRLEVDATA